MDTHALPGTATRVELVGVTDILQVKPNKETQAAAVRAVTSRVNLGTWFVVSRVHAACPNALCQASARRRLLEKDQARIRRVCNPNSVAVAGQSHAHTGDTSFKQQEAVDQSLVKRLRPHILSEWEHTSKNTLGHESSHSTQNTHAIHRQDKHAYVSALFHSHRCHRYHNSHGIHCHKQQRNVAPT